MIEEIWKPVINYEGLYEISNYGKVKSLNYKRTKKEQILKPLKEMGSYLCVILFKNNGGKQHSIHRLVLEAFVGPCPPGMEGCHNNGNPSDNFVGNLRWDTRSNNQKDRKWHGTKNNPIWINNMGSKSSTAKLNNTKIIEIKKLHLEGESNIKIAKIYNVHPTTISRIINEETWKYIE